MPTCLCESKTKDRLQTVVLFCDVHIDISMTLNLLYSACVLFVDVESYRLIVNTDILQLSPMHIPYFVNQELVNLGMDFNEKTSHW